MVARCVIPECNNTPSKAGYISIHKFPENDHIRQKWIDAVRYSRSGFKPPGPGNTGVGVCSEHFQDQDFEVPRSLRIQFGYTGNLKLKDDAIPTLNLGTKCQLPVPREPVAKLVESFSRTEKEPRSLLDAPRIDDLDPILPSVTDAGLAGYMQQLASGMLLSAVPLMPIDDEHLQLGKTTPLSASRLTPTSLQHHLSPQPATLPALPALPLQSYSKPHHTNPSGPRQLMFKLNQNQPTSTKTSAGDASTKPSTSSLHDKVQVLLAKNLSDDELQRRLLKLLDQPATVSVIDRLTKLQNHFNLIWEADDSGDSDSDVADLSSFESVNLHELTQDFRKLKASLDKTKWTMKQRLERGDYAWDDINANITLSQTYMIEVVEDMKDMQAELQSCLIGMNEVYAIMDEFKRPLEAGNMGPGDYGTDDDVYVKSEPVDDGYQDGVSVTVENRCVKIEPVGPEDTEPETEMDPMLPDDYTANESIVGTIGQTKTGIMHSLDMKPTRNAPKPEISDTIAAPSFGVSGSEQLNSTLAAPSYGSGGGDTVQSGLDMFCSSGTDDDQLYQSTDVFDALSVTPAVAPVSNKRPHDEELEWTGIKRSKPSSYDCDSCSATFSKRWQLSEHYTIHTAYKFRCRVCSKGFDDQNSMYEHEKTHDDTVPQPRYAASDFKCAVCGLTFRYKWELGIHHGSHNPDAKFRCRRCNRGFYDEALREAHEDSHLNKIECSECGSYFESKAELTTHLYEHPAKVCEECSQEFRTTFDLVSHLAVHAQPNHRCRICNAGFVQKKDVREHEVVHITPSRKLAPCFPCDSCPMKFKSRVDLSMHYTMNHKAFKFRCRVCYKGFQHEMALRIHEETMKHDDKPEIPEPKPEPKSVEKPTVVKSPTVAKIYKCRVCSAKFKLEGALKTHEEQKHPESNLDSTRVIPEEALECKYCSKTFKKERARTIHENLHTCHVCNLTFPNLNERHRHVVSEHPLSVEVNNGDEVGDGDQVGGGDEDGADDEYEECEDDDPGGAGDMKNKPCDEEAAHSQQGNGDAGSDHVMVASKSDLDDSMSDVKVENL